MESTLIEVVAVALRSQVELLIRETLRGVGVRIDDNGGAVNIGGDLRCSIHLVWALRLESLE